MTTASFWVNQLIFEAIFSYNIILYLKNKNSKTFNNKFKRNENIKRFIRASAKRFIQR